MDTLFWPHTQHLWLFSLMVFGIIALPGLDMAYVAASALAGGRRHGLAAVAGIVAGGMVHVLMTTLGLGLLLTLYPLAFNVLLLVGSLYIAWIGWGLWRGATALGEIGTMPRLNTRQTIWRGALSCLMNPKAYVFMVAIFPQFMRPHYGPLALQALLMGLIISLTQVLVYGAMAWGAGSIQQWLRSHPASQVRLGQAVGLLLMLAAVWTGWSGWRTGG
ncbi:LysE family translocator [Rhodoferax sp.]|uniref:LysE family translocator n=1 Tax=Rhodoferax sp. TaxID=50421 RepID=UPI00262F15E2|nr:LysE family translocator [Rhodoferax sp.]MDD2925806.1 LysE family translocator [Rhodoferax sp.]